MTYKRILLTGAAGKLGTVLRPRLAASWPLRSSDRVAFGPPLDNEEIRLADLGDRPAMLELAGGCDALVHFGGISTESDFDRLLEGNILGLYNAFEAARQHEFSRIVFASSNHTIGFYRRDEHVDIDSPVRPDSKYGVSKVFAEALGRFFVDNYDMEVVCLRIGSCLERPRDRRHLSTWLSYDDLFRLVHSALVADAVGFTIAFGQSANDRGFWNNAKASQLGFAPRDNAERFAAEILASTPPPDPKDPRVRFQGGNEIDGYVKR